ncbi:MAG: phage tail protein [Crocinitomix sp.]|nr:phage tail protein [Crocinitomix sp.]
MTYPLTKFHFQVEWGGTKLGFTEVSGLSVETKAIEYRDGASPEYTKMKMPGMQEYGNITLKRGAYKGDNQFFDWWNKVHSDEFERRDIIISMLNDKHEPTVAWKVRRAWAIKVDSGDLKSDGNEVSIETLELAHEGISIEHV